MISVTGQRFAGTSAGQAIATVTRKLSAAEPPELVAVTVTCAPATAASVGIEMRPVVASMLAPAPVTE